MALIIPTLPEGITLEQIKQTREALVHFYPKELGFGEIVPQEPSWSIPSLNLSWKNEVEFFPYVSALTGVGDKVRIKDADYVLDQWETALSQKPPQQPAATTPGKEQLEKLEEDAERRAVEQKEAKAKAEKETRETIERGQEEYEKQQKQVAHELFQNIQDVPTAAKQDTDIKQPTQDQKRTGETENKKEEVPDQPTTSTEKIEFLLNKAEEQKPINKKSDVSALPPKQKQDTESHQKAKDSVKELIQTAGIEKIVVTPKDKIPTVTLNKNEKEKLLKLGTAAKIDPGTTQKVIEEKIKEALSKSDDAIKAAVPKETITKAAVNLVDKLGPFGNYKTVEEMPNEFPITHPASPIVAISDPDDKKLKEVIPNKKARQILTSNAQALALAIGSETNVNSTLASPLFEESNNIISLLYSSGEIPQFEVADDQETDEGININVREVVDQGKQIRGLWQKIVAGSTTAEDVAATIPTFVASYSPSITIAVGTQATSLLVKALPTVGAVYGFSQGPLLFPALASQGFPLLGDSLAAGKLTSSGITSLITTSNSISSKMLFDVSAGKFSFQLMSAAGKTETAFYAKAAFGEKIFNAYLHTAPGYVNAGIVTKVGALPIKKELNLFLGTKAAKIIGKASGLVSKVAGVVTKIGAALGSFAPIVGHLIGAAIGWLVGKIVEKIPWGKVIKALPYVAGGIAFVVWGPTIGAAVGLGSYALVAGFSGAGVAAAGTGILLISRRIAKSLVFGIGVPAIVTVIAFPLVVALFLFIINSGAYMVPPSDKYSSLNNTYVSVEKIAVPGGPFQNTELPKEITYTITIKAKKSALTINSWKHECWAYSKNGKFMCDSPPPPDQLPITISPSSDFSYTYSTKYEGGKYFDSAIINTFSINANSPEENNISTSGSATIIVGEPPTKCFKFDGSWKKYANSQESVTEAIANLSEADVYLSTLCQGGREITLSYSGVDVGYGGEIVGDGKILFHYAGVYLNRLVTLYTVVHETGHVFAQRTKIDEEYYDNVKVAAERPICTYPWTTHAASEDFAEMIALFVTKKAGSLKADCLTNFKTQYPNHWRFAYDKIFKEKLNW